VKRGREPSRGLYAFPGGRVENGETDEDAARRELLEETGVEVGALSPLRDYIIDASLEERMVTYRLRVFLGQDASGDPVPGDDAEQAGFYTLPDMEAMPMTDSVLEVARELLGTGEKPIGTKDL